MQNEHDIELGLQVILASDKHSAARSRRRARWLHATSLLPSRPGKRRIAAGNKLLQPGAKAMPDFNVIKAAFLTAIAMGEDYNPRDYNELVGGGTFDSYNSFPEWSGHQFATGISHAAGRYQFEPATWREVSAKLGLTNFSPASQDAAAWDLASTVYSEMTRRTLLIDLQQMYLTEIPPALQSTWTSISATTFAERYTIALSNAQSDTT